MNDFYPCYVEPDGNCFFRSLSKSLYGTELYHEELRARLIIEMIIYHDKYLNSDLVNLMLENPIYDSENNGDHPNLITFLANMTSSSENTADNGQVFCQEIVRMSILREWGSLWHMFAIANALKIKIHQFYPDVNDNMDTVPYKVLNGKINGSGHLDQSMILVFSFK